MSTVTDLDIMVPEDKSVRLGGVEYPVPADMPMEIFLRMNKTVEGEDQGTQLTRLVDAVCDLLAWDKAEADPEGATAIRDTVRSVLMRRGVKFTFSVIREIYKADDEADDEAAAARPTEDQAPPAEGLSGTTSTSTLPAPTTEPTVIRAAEAPVS